MNLAVFTCYSYSKSMNPITHGLIGWTGGLPLAHSLRDHFLITASSMLPDVDGFGAIIDLIAPDPEVPMKWFSTFHHQFGHNILAAVVTSICLSAVAHKKIRMFFLSMFFFHLHLLCDIIGAKGPDGDHWPIPYLYPFSDSWQLTWSGQWEINAWPNLLLTVVLLGIFLWQCRIAGYSPLWLISERADKLFVQTLLKRFPLTISETDEK